jgi:DNA modification methylase
MLDPFAGSGTSLVVAKRLGYRFTGIEMHPKYVDMINARLGSML